MQRSIFLFCSVHATPYFTLGAHTISNLRIGHQQSATLLIHCLKTGLWAKCSFTLLLKPPQKLLFTAEYSCSVILYISQIMNLFLTFVVRNLKCGIFSHCVNSVLFPCQNKLLFSLVSPLPLYVRLRICWAYLIFVIVSIIASHRTPPPRYLSGCSWADITTTINFSSLEMMKASVENSLSLSLF